MYRFILLLATVCALSLLAVSAAFASGTLVQGKATAGTAASTHPASYMNDGKTTTYWAAASKAVPPIVTIDLGAPAALSASDVVWNVRGKVGFRTYGSNDGAVWTRIASQDATRLKSTRTAVGGRWRYIRMRIGSLSSGSAAIKEWRLYAATATPALTPTPAANPIAAINGAAAGQTVTVGAGTYAGNIKIPSGVTVQGAGMDSSWIKGTVVYGSDVIVRDVKLGDSNCSTRNGSGAGSTLFERVRFVGGGQSGVSWPNNSVLVIGSQYSVDHLTFKDCVVERNMGSDPDFSKGFNNISLIERSGVHVASILFDGCRVAGSPRMGLEAVVQSGATKGFTDITLRDSTFASADSETLDFSDQPTARAVGILIEGCTIRGGGVTQVKWGYGLCLEMPLHVVVRNNTFTRAWMQSLVITPRSETSFTGPAMQITGNTFDLTTGPASSGCEPIVLKSTGNVFSGNTLKGGWGVNVVGLWSASGTRVAGNTFTSRDGAAAILQHSGCSGNTLTPNTIQ